MIRLPYHDGFLLVPQPAHAWVSGQLARAWGGPNTDAPAPLEAVVLATTLHDIGWLELDPQPLLNADGQPLSFLEPGFAVVAPKYIRGIEAVALVDPYAALLVNRHVQLIFEGRVARGTDAPDVPAQTLARLRADHGQLVARLAGHPAYRAHLNAATLAHNYRILRTCDLLSLFVLGGLPPRTVPDAPTRYGAEARPLVCTLQDANTLVVHPSPFAAPTQTFTVEARYIPGTRHTSPADYARAFAGAERVTLEKRVIAG